MRLPASSPPVNAMRCTFGWRTSGSATSAPNPVTTLTTPGGSPASTASFANSSSDADVYSDGLQMIVLPAHSAGAIFHAVSDRDEFHGVMLTTTPMGS